MKKILNKRLETLSAFINDNEVVLDIGCDHGLLGIYLTLNKNNIRVISSDINKNPLEKAKENINKYGLNNKIEVRLGDGLSIMTNDINTIVISGMGALNIINILKDVQKYSNVSKLVLSPNNDFKLLRKEICKLGFKIKKEEMILEKGKYYLISEFIKGKERVNYFFGRLNLNNKTVRDYYHYVYDNNKKILNNLNWFNKLKRIYLIKENYIIRKHIS